MRACDDINVRPLLPDDRVHGDRDRIAPPHEGRILAAEIHSARYAAGQRESCSGGRRTGLEDFFGKN
jgi:hypothetical protein